MWFAVIIIGVDSGNRAAAVGVQRREVALEQAQAVQCKRLHAVQLSILGNQTLLIFFLKFNRAVHLLPAHPHTVQGAVVVLGDKFL